MLPPLCFTTMFTINKGSTVDLRKFRCTFLTIHTQYTSTIKTFANGLLLEWSSDQPEEISANDEAYYPALLTHKSTTKISMATFKSERNVLSDFDIPSILYDCVHIDTRNFQRHILIAREYNIQHDRAALVSKTNEYV